MILTLLKMRKSFSKANFILMSVNKKVFSKNQDFSSLLSPKKEGIIMLKVSSLLPAIFYAPTLVLQTWRKGFLAKYGYIILISLFELRKTSIESWANEAEYCIYRIH